VDASEIEVAVDGDVVVLRGKVYDRAQKRAAEDVVENVSGVRDVRNELQVEKGMLQELTDAVTGRSDDEEQRGSRTPPRQARVS
jgi:Flp pilus assembly secretin CpaC